jgi:hypothetical protein
MTREHKSNLRVATWMYILLSIVSVLTNGQLIGARNTFAESFNSAGAALATVSTQAFLFLGGAWGSKVVLFGTSLIPGWTNRDIHPNLVYNP